jgi:hypothetical protein
MSIDKLVIAVEKDLEAVRIAEQNSASKIESSSCSNCQYSEKGSASCYYPQYNSPWKPDQNPQGECIVYRKRTLMKQIEEGTKDDRGEVYEMVGLPFAVGALCLASASIITGGFTLVELAWLIVKYVFF